MMVDSSDIQALKEKLEEVLADEAFARELFEKETVEDVQAALEEKGIELSKDEILGVRDALVKMQEKGVSPDELTEDELEEVSGGSLIFIIIMSGVAFGAAATMITLLYSRW